MILPILFLLLPTRIPYPLHPTLKLKEEGCDGNISSYRVLTESRSFSWLVVVRFHLYVVFASPCSMVLAVDQGR